VSRTGSTCSLKTKRRLLADDLLARRKAVDDLDLGGRLQAQLDGAIGLCAFLHHLHVAAAEVEVHDIPSRTITLSRRARTMEMLAESPMEMSADRWESLTTTAFFRSSGTSGASRQGHDDLARVDPVLPAHGDFMPT